MYGLKAVFLYYSTSQSGSSEAVDRIFKTLTATQTDTVRPKRLRIKGREVDFSKTCGKILDTTFDELCKRVRECRYVNVKLSGFTKLLAAFREH